MLKRISRQRGSALAGFLGFLFLLYFGGSIFLYFLHKEGLFRFEFGREKTVEETLILSDNQVRELLRREKFLNEELRKVERQKEYLEELRKQVEIERARLGEDKEFISDKMAEITERFRGLTEEEEKNLQDLAKVYAKMKANRVANIFNELDDETIAKLLRRMQDKVSAKVLGEIGTTDAKRAALISDIIQGKMDRKVFREIP